MTTKQSPIVPVRVKPDMKEQFLLAADYDGFDSLAAWVKAQCQRRVNELVESKAFLIKRNELPY